MSTPTWSDLLNVNSARIREHYKGFAPLLADDMSPIDVFWKYARVETKKKSAFIGFELDNNLQEVLKNLNSSLFQLNYQFKDYSYALGYIAATQQLTDENEELLATAILHPEKMRIVYLQETMNYWVRSTLEVPVKRTRANVELTKQLVDDFNEWLIANDIAGVAALKVIPYQL